MSSTYSAVEGRFIVHVERLLEEDALRVSVRYSPFPGTVLCYINANNEKKVIKHCDLAVEYTTYSEIGPRLLHRISSMYDQIKTKALGKQKEYRDLNRELKFPSHEDLLKQYIKALKAP